MSPEWRFRIARNTHTDIGLMHTLFTLEDTRGLKIGKLDGELCLRLDKDAGMTYHSMWDMFNTWYQQAEKLESGEITKEQYDQWCILRVNRPSFTDK